MDKEQTLKVALPILQGLLASGHYTTPGDAVENTVEVERYDCGKDWKEDGFARRHTAIAIDHALELAEELVKQIELNAEPK